MSDLHTWIIVKIGRIVAQMKTPAVWNYEAAEDAERHGHTVAYGRRKGGGDAIVCRVVDIARYLITPARVVVTVACAERALVGTWEEARAATASLGEFLQTLPAGANGNIYVTDAGVGIGSPISEITVYRNRRAIAQCRYDIGGGAYGARVISAEEGETMYQELRARNRAYDAEYDAASRSVAEDLRKGGRNTRYSAGQEGGVLTLGNEGRAVSARAHGVWFGPWLEGEGGIVAELRADEKANHDEREMLNAGLTRVNPLRHRGHAVRVAGAWWAAPSRYRMGSRTPLGAVRGVMK